jgi:hypothetical protein
MGVQALRSEGSVEGFHKRIVGWLPGTQEVDLDPVLISPQIHGLTGELAAVVTKQQLRRSPFLPQPV